MNQFCKTLCGEAGGSAPCGEPMLIAARKRVGAVPQPPGNGIRGALHHGPAAPNRPPPLRERPAPATLPAMFRRLILLATLALSACAQHTSPPLASAPRPRPVWAMLGRDIPLDPDFRTSRLANGMRYVIRRGTTPRGTALVRMEIGSGSLDEADSERGYAHFVEHMAFNGSTRVPEGEMIRLLERHGLAFGADTNAQTSFHYTLYTLDLPRANAEMLDISLMLMRETASELTMSPEAVNRERGVVLSEMRDRNSWQLRAAVDEMNFTNPGALYARRLPIGTAETLGAATAQSLRAFWQREYVPANTTLVVVGDFDPAAVEAAIAKHFASWPAQPAQPQPDAGPVLAADKGRTGIYLDPALSERVTAARNGPFLDEPDSVASRRESLLRQIGYDILNRRLLRLTRQADAPFRSAGFSTGEVFRSGRTTTLAVDTIDGGGRAGLAAAAREYRRAMTYGFSAEEIAEQVAIVRTAHRNAAAGSATRSNAALVAAALALVRDDFVPATPESSLARLETFIPAITPQSVMAALRRQAVALEDPLLRFAGKAAPEGGEAPPLHSDLAMPISAPPAPWWRIPANRCSGSAPCASPTAFGSTSSRPISKRIACWLSLASMAAICW